MTRFRAEAVARVWEGQTPVTRVARTVLGLPAGLYGAAIGLRNRGFDRGWWRTDRVDARVLSVGNLTVGGTGKTPTSLWLAEALRRRGRRVAIVARGYRKTRRGVVIVGCEGRALVGPDEGGDEAVMLASRFAGPVVTGERRVDAARAAIAEFAVDTIVLDDGFQHRALARDADLVLLRSDPAAARLLPAGPLREPARALRRATAVLILGDADLSITLSVPPPVFRGRIIAQSVIRALGAHRDERPLTTLRGREVVAVSGIARPEAFQRMLVAQGAHIVHAFAFPDHHRYDDADLRQIARIPAPVVTTEKDLPKLAGRIGREMEALRVGLALDDEAALLRALTRAASVDFGQD